MKKKNWKTGSYCPICKMLNLEYIPPERLKSKEGTIGFICGNCGTYYQVELKKALEKFGKLPEEANIDNEGY